MPRGPSSSTHSRRAFRGIAAIFLVNGLTLSSWISRIPSIADELDLGTGTVGTALMALAAGAIVAFPITGRLVDARSSARTLLIFGLVMFLTLPLIGLAPHVLVLMPILFVFGAGNGGMDVSMNAQGIEVERAVGRSIMSSLHGFFSLGAVIGAGGGALAASLDVPPFAHFLIVTAIGLTVLARVRSWLIPDIKEPRGDGAPAPAFSLPPRSLWALGALAMAASISEGAMADWSGLYLHEDLGTSSGFAALGYASFSVLMLTGRFSGDKLVARFGAPAMVRSGGALAAIGLGIAVLVNEPVVLLLGFGAVGLGLSVAYPLVFSAAGNHPTLSRGQAVASVATLGYAGFLAGPPLLGWLAEPTSLRVVMVIIVVLAALVALLANATRAAATTRRADGGRAGEQ
jgi:MFS family permease